MKYYLYRSIWPVYNIRFSITEKNVLIALEMCAYYQSLAVCLYFCIFPGEPDHTVYDWVFKVCDIFSNIKNIFSFRCFCKFERQFRENHKSLNTNFLYFCFKERCCLLSQCSKQSRAPVLPVSLNTFFCKVLNNPDMLV